MKGNRKIVVIGGTACEPKTAARARRCDPHAEITIIEQYEYLSSATCGFPYYVGGLIKQRNSLDVVKPAHFKSTLDIDVLNNTRALEINRREQKVRVTNLVSGENASLGYDKLVIATGSIPISLPCDGSELGGIYPLRMMLDAVNVRQLVEQRKIKKAVVVGSGLIGLEVAEALAAQGLQVTMIEALDWLLPRLVDFEIATYAERELKKRIGAAVGNACHQI
jgi:NADPH-dependent 2,4-dienoyl-CoA reductase/sulfur reductase-like enzyme